VQTNSEAALVQYPDGPERWTIFKDGEPVVAFPVYEGDIANALQFHDIARLRMQKPAEMREELDRERAERRDKIRRLGRRKQSEPAPAEDLDEDLDGADGA
jgi:hypothetical protein